MFTSQAADKAIGHDGSSVAVLWNSHPARSTMMNYPTASVPNVTDDALISTVFTGVCLMLILVAA
eukprot:6203428-Amphidinium_carterae.1